jgi:hypothetical protein
MRLPQKPENMVTRSKRLRMTFCHPFTLKGAARPFPLGDYEVVIDAELTGESYSPTYRQVSTLIHVPPQAYRPSSIKRVNIDLSDLLAAHHRDQAMKASSAD